MTTQQAGNLTLRVEQAIRAPRERVFDAWTRNEQLQRWSAPEGMSIPEGDADVRVGGRYRVVMLEPNGTRHTALGVYREVVRPSRLVYTHAWVLDNGNGGETTPVTIVTVEFHARDGGTLVVLTQEGFESAESREGHRGGWSSALSQLRRLLEGQG